MASLHPSELDSVASDSVASTPRSDHPSHELNSRARFMCSFGGKILPRPHDNQLRYVGGDTRIVAVHRAAGFSSLLSKLSKLSGLSNVTVKYQLPNEELDSLISVTTDEDVDNMMEEYDRIAQNENPKSARLRLFLFPIDEDSINSRSSSISSLLDGSAKRELWFLDALNSGASNSSLLERGRSEASSIISEVPDYLFGLENSDDTHPRGEYKPKPRPVLHDNVSVSDPGSPAPVSSPFCSISSVPSVPAMPSLPPVKTRADSSQVVETKENQLEGFAETVEVPVSKPTGFSANPAVQYIPDPNYPGHVVGSGPVYYYPGSVQPPNVPVQQIPIRSQYVHHPQYQVQGGQIPVGYHNQIPGMGQVYGGGLRPVAALDHPYDVSGRIVSDGVNQHSLQLQQQQQQQVYYEVRNAAAMPAEYNPGMPGMVVPSGGEEWHGPGSGMNTGRVGCPINRCDNA